MSHPVRVWGLKTPDDNPAVYARLEGLLTPEEQLRARAFRFDSDRRDYVAAHALLQSVFARELKRDRRVASGMGQIE
ncbi:MAG: hypothetical protein AAFQ82_26730, partial [Myxococcota bacterium]